MLPTTNEGEANRIVHEMLEKAASLRLGDWFVYGIRSPVKDLEGRPVEALGIPWKLEWTRESLPAFTWMWGSEMP